MRSDHMSRGLPINLESLTNHRDMPRDTRTVGLREVLSSDRRLSKVFRCHYHEIWQEGSNSDVGQVYCDYVHHAIWQAYHPGIELALEKTLTRGDEICLFNVHCDLSLLEQSECDMAG